MHPRHHTNRRRAVDGDAAPPPAPDAHPALRVAEAIASGKYDSPTDEMSAIRAALVEGGCREALGMSPWDAAGAVCLTEAVNAVAKWDWEDGDPADEAWYLVKPWAVVVAAQLGATIAWGDDGTIALYAEGAGVATFHDPYGEIEDIARRRGVAITGHIPWSGVRRQDWAFILLANPIRRRAMALATDPRFHPDLRRPAMVGPQGWLP